MTSTIFYSAHFTAALNKYTLFLPHNTSVLIELLAEHDVDKKQKYVWLLTSNSIAQSPLPACGRQQERFNKNRSIRVHIERKYIGIISPDLACWHQHGHPEALKLRQCGLGMTLYEEVSRCPVFQTRKVYEKYDCTVTAAQLNSNSMGSQEPTKLQAHSSFIPYLWCWGKMRMCTL